MSGLASPKRVVLGYPIPVPAPAEKKTHPNQRNRPIRTFICASSSLCYGHTLSDSRVSQDMHPLDRRDRTFHPSVIDNGLVFLQNLEQVSTTHPFILLPQPLLLLFLHVRWFPSISSTPNDPTRHRSLVPSLVVSNRRRRTELPGPGPTQFGYVFRSSPSSDSLIGLSTAVRVRALSAKTSNPSLSTRLNV